MAANYKNRYVKRGLGIDELQIGSVYFSLGYVDNEMSVPVLETLVYIGTSTGEAGNLSYLFQDAESYCSGVGEVHLLECSEDVVGGLSNLADVIAELGTRLT